MSWAPTFPAGAHLCAHGSSSPQVTYQVLLTKCFLFLHLFFSFPGTKDPPCHRWLWHKGFLHFGNFCGSDFSPLHGNRSFFSSEITRGPDDMGNNFFGSCLPDVPNGEHSLQKSTPSSVMPAPSWMLLSPLPTALALKHPPEEVCALATPPSATGFPANENVAPLVEGQPNPPNSCCTWVVSQWTSMLGKAARPWWGVCACVLGMCTCLCVCVCTHVGMGACV